MQVTELWRYPVKSLRGESLLGAELEPFGIHGDRLVHVLRESGRVMTSRTHSKLLGLQGSLTEDGTPTIEGIPWHDPAALALVRKAAGEDVELVYYNGDGPQRFDVLPLSLATDAASRPSASTGAAFARTSTSTASRD